MKKQKQPEFIVGDIVRVLMPTMALNFAKKDGENKLDIEEVMLIGDEGMIVLEVEFIKNSNEYLYKISTESSLEASFYSIPEEQLTLYY